MSFSDHTQSGAPDLSVGYAAALGSAALFDRSAAGRIRIRGADRAAWLQGLVTNDVAALRPGHGCYAAFLTAQGRMISDMRVLAFEHSLLLDVPDSTKDAVLNRLDQFVITEDVALADETLSTARFTVFGPAGAALLAQALAGRDVGAEGVWIRALEALPEHGHLSAPSGQGGLVVARAWELGNSGFDVYCESNRRQSVWAAFTAGAMVPALGDAWQTLRIEAGIPTFGTDMDEETIPLEAGIERRA
ncbi:MAG: folate-binding protein YgfZ, partial [Planctomycetaceae bacterium]